MRNQLGIRSHGSLLMHVYGWGGAGQSMKGWKAAQPQGADLKVSHVPPVARTE